MTTEAYVQDYIQVGHRLIDLPGKCQQIHGHSMLVRLYIVGVNKDGYIVDAEGTVLDFSDIKRVFRNYLTAEYDHHLLLNERDPWAQPIYRPANEAYRQAYTPSELPGLTKCVGDPTTENIAKWIAEHMNVFFPVSKVTIEETKSNGVTHKMVPEPELYNPSQEVEKIYAD